MYILTDFYMVMYLTNENFTIFGGWYTGHIALDTAKMNYYT